MAEPLDQVEARVVEQAAHHADLMRYQRLKFLVGRLPDVVAAELASVEKRLVEGPGPASPASPGGIGAG